MKRYGLGLPATLIASLAALDWSGLLYVPGPGDAKPHRTTLEAEAKKVKAFYALRPRPWRWPGNNQKRTRRAAQAAARRRARTRLRPPPKGD